MNKTWGVLLVVVLAASCGANETNTSDEVAPDDTTLPDKTPDEVPDDGPEDVPDNDGGFGAPSQTAGEFGDDYSPYTVTGTLQLADTGCWYIELNGVERLLVFPEGFSFAESDTTTIVDAESVEFHTGDAIDGVTTFRHESTLPGGTAGKWGNYLTFCDPSIRELAVFDTMTPAYDPTELTEADIASRVAEAEFDQHWPCGRGWAVSTADQRVGILIYQIDDQQPSPGEGLELPNPAWMAEVVVGKHLFISHCNDAIEEWVPEPIQIGSFPITGTITVHDDVPNNDDLPASVSATLEASSITIGTEEVAFPTIDLLNTGYNAFAG